MMLEALIVSRDRKIVSPFRTAFESAQVRVSVSSSVEDGVDRLANDKFDAIVVDASDSFCGAEVLQMLRRGVLNRRSIVFAVIGENSQLKRAFDLGANFVMEKPVVPDDVQRGIRAAHGLMVRERRRYHRHDVENTTAQVVLSDGRELQVEVTNVSEGGMALRVSQKNMFHGPTKVRFFLPDSKVPFRVRGEVAWTHPGGDIGIRFDEMSLRCRVELRRWCSERLALLVPVAYLNHSRYLGGMGTCEPL